VTLSLHPADAGTGIRFIRTGLEDRCDREIRADIHAVTATEFATVLGDESGPLVSTAEHVLAALRGLGVDNAIVEIDGPEAPIMDGSAGPFVAAIDQVGLQTFDAPRRHIRVLKPVRAAVGDAYGEIRPCARGFRVEVEIEFDHPLIGRQAYVYDGKPDTFRRDIARARTFGFMRDVAKLWDAGYALGASLENTLVVTENRVLNPEGTRFPDEFARHKVLDAVGDLALAGAPLLGAYHSVRGGHKLNYSVLSALLADTSAWTMVEGEAVRPMRGHADMAIGQAAPVYAPDVS
jgi:UDP-3-O-[3-hydroxymyristoyl] N-acetylglucosamine deacetylase